MTPPTMDGFVKPKPVTGSVAPVGLMPSPSPAKKHRSSVQAPKPAPKSAKRSTTLMRTAVKKPSPTAADKSLPALAKPQSLPAKRLHRAHATSKSHLISKFGHDSRPAIAAKVEKVPVKAPPLVTPRPVMDLRQQIAAVTGQVSSTKQAFERAIHQADSHKQPKIRKPKLSHRVAKKIHVPPRVIGTATGLAAALLIAGFFMYQNAPQLSMRVAATRAGVAAALPSYQPAGFSLSRQIEYAPGEITVSYHSNSDERAFDLTQKKTTLTPQELADELTSGGTRPYQTYNDEGLTIYIYDGSNAAWIDQEQGVLYQIEGESALNSDQLIRLATSI